MTRNFGQSEDFKLKSLSKLQMRSLSMNITYERCHAKARGFKIHFCSSNMPACTVVEVAPKTLLPVFDAIAPSEPFCTLKRKCLLNGNFWCYNCWDHSFFVKRALRDWKPFWCSVFTTNYGFYARCIRVPRTGSKGISIDPANGCSLQQLDDLNRKSSVPCRLLYNVDRVVLQTILGVSWLHKALEFLARSVDERPTELPPLKNSLKTEFLCI